jgi:hypothetical protein
MTRCHRPIPPANLAAIISQDAIATSTAFNNFYIEIAADFTANVCASPQLLAQSHLQEVLKDSHDIEYPVS